MTCIPTRLTSKDLVIEFQPYKHPRAFYRADTDFPTYGVSQSHVQNLTVPAAITAGSYRIRVNGYLSAPILYSSNAAAVELIVEAITGVGAGNLTVSGSLPNLVLTATLALQNQFLFIEVVDGDLTGGTVTTEVATQGSAVYTLSADMSMFSYSSTTETTDATAIAERARTHILTVSDATFDFGLYEALQDWRHIIIDGMQGWLWVYENGKGVGKRYFSWCVALTDASSSFEQFEKIEIECSGRRQGEDIVLPGSYQL